MATQAEEDGIGAPPTIGLALSGSKSSAYVLQWALAKFAKDDSPAPAAAFRLIHVLTRVLAVPTALGNYVKKVRLKAQEMLAGYKTMCDENKVKAQVLLVNGNDVAETISNLAAQYQIQILVIGNPTRSAFTSMNENSSGRGPSGFPSLPRSNLASESLQRSSSAERHRSFTLYDYLTGDAIAYNEDKDSRITSNTESSISSKLRDSDEVPTQDRSLQGLMLSDNKLGNVLRARKLLQWFL